MPTRLLPALLLLLAACRPQPPWTIYQCPDRQTFQVSRTADAQWATLRWAGREVRLPRAPASSVEAFYSGEGAIHLGIDGDVAFVAEGERVVHENCRALKAEESQP